MSASIKFMGANRVVTGSKYLLSVGQSQVMFDCGMYQGLKELRLRNWSPPPLDPAKVNAVVISHAHIDHTGYLPCLVRRGYNGPVYATPATCDLLGLLLPDSARLMMEEADFANRAGYSKHSPALPLFDTSDAEKALRMLRPVRYGETVEAAPGVSFSYRIAGHILGSAITTFRLESATLTFTGDLGRYDRPILKDPEPVDASDVLVTESTYGDRIHAPDHVEQLTDAIRQVAANAGCLLVPAFAVGRTQELIYMIRELEERGAIPVLPVHVDSPMAVDATEIYARHTEEHDLDMTALEQRHISPLRTGQFFLHRSVEESKSLNSAGGPLVIISASGMASGGRILHHLKLRLPRPETLVLLVGYQAEGTRGRALQDGATSVQMFGVSVPVRAAVKTIDGLSAHADQAELIRWSRGFKQPPRTVYITHGEDLGAFGLKKKLEEVFNWHCVVPNYGDEASVE